MVRIHDFVFLGRTGRNEHRAHILAVLVFDQLGMGDYRRIGIGQKGNELGIIFLDEKNR